MVKFSRKPAFFSVNTIFFLMWVTVAGLLAEERTSAAPTRPLTADPKELGYKVELMAAEELKKLMDEGANPLVVDTQDELIYSVKHIRGAINFPWAPVIREPINLPRNKLLILYCGCVGEEASKSVARQLMANWGFKQIRVLDGGFNRWLRLGYPTEP